MAPLLERLQGEEGVAIQQYEVWHNKENARKLEQYDKGLCGGVPFFFNVETNDFLCGAVPYEVLRQWAIGKTT